MKRGRRTLVAVLVLTVAVVAGGVVMTSNTYGQADGTTQIEGCYTITQPGTYVLTANVTNGGGDNFTFISETCIRIAASNVVLDGQGHTVDGYGISDTTGIGVEEGASVSDVTVKNVHVTDWNRGVYFGNVDGATARNVNASGNSYGFFVENATGTTIRGSTANGNFIGIYHQNARGNTFRENALRRNHIAGVVWGDRAEGGTSASSASDAESRNRTAARDASA